MASCLEYSYEDSVENLRMGRPIKSLCESVINKKYVGFGDDGGLIGMMMSSDIEDCGVVEEKFQNKEVSLEAVEFCYYEVAIVSRNVSICDGLSLPVKYYCIARAG